MGTVRGVARCPCRGLSGLRRWVCVGSGARLAGSSPAPLPTASVSPPPKWGELQTLPQDPASRCTLDSPVLPGEESAQAGRASAFVLWWLQDLLRVTGNPLPAQRAVGRALLRGLLLTRGWNLHLLHFPALQADSPPHQAPREALVLLPTPSSPSGRVRLRLGHGPS